MKVIVIIFAFGLAFARVLAMLDKTRNTSIHSFPQHSFDTFSDEWRTLMTNHCSYYKALKPESRAIFEAKVCHFLSIVKIVPIDFEAHPNDYLFVAAGAVLPTLHLSYYAYPHLKYVVLHPQTFGMFEDDNGDTLHTAGYIAPKRFPDRLHLARNVVWHDFLGDTDSNVAIHEFIHLLDFGDRKMDGIPEGLMDKKHIEPWIKLMIEEMESIKNGYSSINNYAGENAPEFLSTVVEYYFKKHDVFRQKHPRVCEVLDAIFKKEHHLG